MGTMTKARAFEINEKLVKGWFVLVGYHNDDVPDLGDLTLEEAEEAREIVFNDPGAPMPENLTRHICTIGKQKLPEIYRRMKVLNHIGRKVEAMAKHHVSGGNRGL